ncbi:MAG: hypothetical protein KKA81_15020 [Bacteroidetes bacterium]|nr:hypothetical protein [Bacteroidota bacterium]
MKLSLCNHHVTWFSLLLILFACQSTHQTENKDIEELFSNPPVKTRPYVWWHWMGPNFSKEGITKDLEAMKEAGIGGATIFNITSAVQESHAPTMNNPWPEQTYHSARYWEAVRFAASEAERLGLEIGLHNTVGYSTTGGPWINEEKSMQRLVWSDTTISGENEQVLKLALPELIADEGWGATGRKLSYFQDIAVIAVPEGKSVLQTGEILELTKEYNQEEGLLWEARPGKWQIYRIGHASTGRPPHPVPDDLIGKVLEADKMSAEQSLWHWQNVIDPLKEHVGDYLGTSFAHMLIDSYEAGLQNWTPGFREEFIALKGYDPLPWIITMVPVITQDESSGVPLRFIQNEEMTRRFEWDYKDVINHLYFRNGFETGKKILQENNLTLQFEPYGGPFSTPQGVALADLPMAEFWTGGTGRVNPLVPAAARAAGKTVVGAEAFTGWPTNSMFTEDPAFLKKSADGSFTNGINRLVLHHWVHQPFDDRYLPGMCMGWWGTHFGRNQTWFEPGKAFFLYLARCQALLQYGEQPSPYLCFETTRNFADVIPKNDFLEADIKVINGNIQLPSGRTYPFMVFHDSLMLPEVLLKLERLIHSGACIVSPKPVSSPSLKDYPGCDCITDSLADLIWGNKSFNKYGKGQVFTSLDACGASLKTDAGIRLEPGRASNNIKVVHRKAREIDIFFIANISDNAMLFNASFPVSGKQPEFWQAEDGTIRDALVWEENQDNTTVPVFLEGNQSVFIVFRKQTLNADHPVSVTLSDTINHWTIRRYDSGKLVFFASAPDTAIVSYASDKKTEIVTPATESIEITGTWDVRFIPPYDTSFSLQFFELSDFSINPSDKVKYFSGTAIYRNTFHLDSILVEKNNMVRLDLGELHDIAEVTVNGSKAVVLWHPPYITEITGLLNNGTNHIEIAVTTNWANRLIGDEQEPADFEWGNDRGESFGRALKAYPEWFINNKPRPSQGRKTFATWFYYRSGSKIQAAGLSGPVRIMFDQGYELH